MAQPKTIAVDIDDVLSATVEYLIEYSNKRWSMNLSMEDYTEELAVFWGVSSAETEQRINEIIQHELVSRYRHLDTAPAILARLKDRYRLVAVTPRRAVLERPTKQWLDKYFPGIFSEVRHAGIWDGPHDVATALKRTKATICRELNAEYLIDDHLKHCAGAASAEIKALLFGEYPWNRAKKLPPGVTRVHNWAEVGAYFDAI